MDTDPRFSRLRQWLAETVPAKLGETPSSEPVPASSDASFRRYFRIEIGERTFIVMDAPPEQEQTEPFVRIAGWLREMGLNAPEVFAWNREEGFVLLSDLGTVDYQQALNEETADALYRDALMALVRMQQAGDGYVDQLSTYDMRLLQEEMALFADWLVERHLSLDTPDWWPETTAALSESALAQPQVFVHRDYHSRNLMVSDPNPGLLDFQDAVRGPLTYDAASLLRDCYVRWPAEQVDIWRKQYFDQLVQVGLQRPEDWRGFVRAFDLMGIQRHLKAAGIFARLWHRDGKSRYLADVPNTLRYIVEVGVHYPETRVLADWVGETVLPAFEAQHA
ncbi:phosphotransferase [Sulfurivirga sp.]|uniref:aminoglycoside phosphotransferase family protein n=1 Tax=Sulfurivirga sp. TaxID=2614236 RepID=UPI0025D2A0F3|nr:phosphotransferase [Sulfurivirga sp.]